MVHKIFYKTRKNGKKLEKNFIKLAIAEKFIIYSNILKVIMKIGVIIKTAITTAVIIGIWE